MAWNDKAARQISRQPVRHLDAFDMEAEREGNATRSMRVAGPNILGRRIAKNRREADGNRKVAEKRGTDYIVATTAAIAKAHTIAEPSKRYNLRQVA